MNQRIVEIIEAGETVYVKSFVTSEVTAFDIYFQTFFTNS